MCFLYSFHLPLKALTPIHNFPNPTTLHLFIIFHFLAFNQTQHKRISEPLQPTPLTTPAFPPGVFVLSVCAWVNGGNTQGKNVWKLKKKKQAAAVEKENVFHEAKENFNVKKKHRNIT